MNIFILDRSPRLAAQYHCDKHVNKMLSETAQMLCTAVFPYIASQYEIDFWLQKNKYAQKQLREKYRERTGLFLPAHKHHPCTKWCGQTRENFLWLLELGYGLIDEWEYRRGKEHGSAKAIHKAAKYSYLIPFGSLTDFVQAFESSYPHFIDPSDPIGAYRKFYVEDKHSFATWNWGREPPQWYVDGLHELIKRQKLSRTILNE